MFVFKQSLAWTAYLETLLPHDALDAWFFNMAYAWREEAALGGVETRGERSSKYSRDTCVFWRDIQVS